MYFATDYQSDVNKFRTGGRSMQQTIEKVVLCKTEKLDWRMHKQHKHIAAESSMYGVQVFAICNSNWVNNPVVNHIFWPKTILRCNLKSPNA